MMNMQVPAYAPAELGTQSVEYSDDDCELKKAEAMPWPDDPLEWPLISTSDRLNAYL